MEPQPGYHSTGRSVSLFCETYGGPVVRALTRASRRFYFEPPHILYRAAGHPASVLMIASSSQTDALQEFFTSATPGDRVERLSSREAIEAFPLLAPERLGGCRAPSRDGRYRRPRIAAGIPTALQDARWNLSADTTLTQLARHGDAWTLSTSRGDIRAATVVNAAGAWAGEIGKLAGAMDIGLRP